MSCGASWNQNSKHLTSSEYFQVNLDDKNGTDNPCGVPATEHTMPKMTFGSRLARVGERIRPKSAVERDDGALTPEPRIVPPAPPPPRRHRLDCRRRRPRAGSCSSSDLSDDDSETRKKRNNTEHDDAPPERTRRDSHDDSSDSQERGAAGGSTSTRPRIAVTLTEPKSSGGGGAAGDARGGGGTTDGRRRRAARKESRLRESRSLNRIAEVEEAAGARWAGSGLAALCGRPLLRLLTAARPAHSAHPPARRLHGLC